MSAEPHFLVEEKTEGMPLLLALLFVLLLLALGLGAEPPAPSSPGTVEPQAAPALPTSGWLNTPDNQPLRLEELRDKVVLVEFWTYGCYNCRNTLPYVKAWHEKYAKEGLTVIGVHTPESAPEREVENVKKAIKRMGITFPVVLDNDFATWERYQNHAWPTIYLIDKSGQVVYRTVGEGNYDRTERRIQELLREIPQAEPTAAPKS